jgi:hypothetical protein
LALRQRRLTAFSGQSLRRTGKRWIEVGDAMQSTTVTVLLLIVAAFALGACAHRDGTTMQTHQTTTSSTGYMK